MAQSIPLAQQTPFVCFTDMASVKQKFNLELTGSAPVCSEEHFGTINK